MNKIRIKVTLIGDNNNILLVRYLSYRIITRIMLYRSAPNTHIDEITYFNWTWPPSSIKYYYIKKNIYILELHAMHLFDDIRFELFAFNSCILSQPPTIQIKKKKKNWKTIYFFFVTGWTY